MSVFFTSDTHFGHEKIIRYVNRPFASAEEMNEAMTRNWNRVVKPGDSVYHLGDFAWGNKHDWIHFRSRLNGNIFLIRGNHDKANLWKLSKDDTDMRLFAWVKEMHELKMPDGQEIVLCHYGLRTWHHDLRGTWHLYGHSHAGLPPYGKSCDVGVDCWNFTPVSYGQLKLKMDALAIGDHPGFKDFEPESESVAKA